ncbi:hypothetical protein [Variovorax sp. PAMC26660]|uniref:hypothetical protein n=1 Tax=Variovorax sp. PAMC26660 TaxID=2762322 RepID=UPI00164DD855|nr:hypothetical protein [Variovorax sp. PAMC26660]QNK66070.1 hypothetical protein H7F35_23095 [Variovorax sp. PAMC26660]
MNGGLFAFSTGQLLAEIKRRADEEELGRSIEHYCDGCEHWRFSMRDDDPESNCTKGHAMQFRMPLDYPDGEAWGFYRIGCPDWAVRPGDAPGPNLNPTPAPAAQSQVRRRTTRQPAHHADATTTQAPPGAAPMLHPMHKRPRPGQRFAVHTRAGLIRHACRATRIVVDDRDGIVIYHGKYAIDESDAIGWWPEARA